MSHYTFEIDAPKKLQTITKIIIPLAITIAVITVLDSDFGSDLSKLIVTFCAILVGIGIFMWIFEEYRELIGDDFAQGFIAITALLFTLTILDKYIESFGLGLASFITGILWFVLLIDFIVKIYRKARYSKPN